MISLKSAPEVVVELARRIRSRRLKRAWTQSEMARRAGLKLPTYVVFERTGKISVLRLIKILEVLDLVSEFERIGTEPDFHGVEFDALVKPQRKRGSRQRS